MDWFLYDNGLRYERIKREAELIAFDLDDNTIISYCMYIVR